MVRALVEPGERGKKVPVHYRLWDVDDPSADVSPIDLTADGAFPVGEDNREPSLLYQVYPNPLLGQSGQHILIPKTSPDKTIYLHVSPRPGDNYRVTATNWNDEDAATTQEMVDREAVGVHGLPKGVKITELWTIRVSYGYRLNPPLWK
jgi:hypothetical protein